jgi:DNA primase
MPRVIAKSVIEDLRDRNDIAEVIGAFVQLKRAGSALKGLCPFHKEKTPSFSVNPQRQIFHCFGCGAGGDVFQFVMQHEGVDFSTAARILAQRCGITLEFDAGEESDARAKDLLYKLHEEAAQFYHRVLTDAAQGEPARRYLEARRLDSRMVKEFLIGYAPDVSDTIQQWGAKRGFSIPQLEAAGLVARNDPAETSRPGVRDRFWKRLMFPVRDEMGRVIAFSGRILPGDDRSAKYLNSPETPLFRKSRVFYALDRARRDILETRIAILCEGQIDVIRCHAAGITTAVAALGTAITEDHARLMRRYADSVVLVLDADTAGQNSAIRSAEIFLGEGLNVRIAALPEGEDPDSLVVRDGPQALQALVDHARTAIDFLVDILDARAPLRTDAGRSGALKAVLDMIGRVPGESQRAFMFNEAARRLGIRPEAIREDFIQRIRARQRGPAATPPEVPAASHPLDEVSLAELLVQHPEGVSFVRSFLPPAILSDPACRSIVERLLAAEDPADADLMEWRSDADAETRRLAAQIQMAHPKLQHAELTAQSFFELSVLTLWQKFLERRQAELRQLQAVAAENDRARMEAERQSLTLDLSTLRQAIFHRDWARALPVLEMHLP